MASSGYLVSVCIPTYNGERFLEETLKSVKEQSYKNIEVVISDNNSSDNTINIINKFKGEVKYPITIVHNEIVGIGSNWNNCIKNSNGDFIKFLFQDDILGEDTIEKLLIPFESNPSLGLSFCNKTLIGDITELDQISNDKHFQRNKDRLSKEMLKSQDFFNQPRNKIGEPPCVLIRREVFDKVGFFDEKLKQSLDYEMNYRIFQLYNISSVNEKLIKFRIHKNQASKINSKSTIIDSYLLPYLVIKNLFWSVHIKVKMIVLYKFLSGLVLYSKQKMCDKKS